MRNQSRWFAIGFGLTLAIFLLLNAWAAHVNSDCGLRAVLGLSGCADDIRRAGFPLQFWEEGGFAYRSEFSAAALLADAVIGLGVSVVGGFVARRWAR